MVSVCSDCKEVTPLVVAEYELVCTRCGLVLDATTYRLTDDLFNGCTSFRNPLQEQDGDCFQRHVKEVLAQASSCFPQMQRLEEAHRNVAVIAAEARAQHKDRTGPRSLSERECAIVAVCRHMDTMLLLSFNGLSLQALDKVQRCMFDCAKKRLDVFGKDVMWLLNNHSSLFSANRQGKLRSMGRDIKDIVRGIRKEEPNVGVAEVATAIARYLGVTRADLFGATLPVPSVSVVKRAVSLARVADVKKKNM